MKRFVIAAAMVLAPLACTFTTTRPELATGPTETSGSEDPGAEVVSAADADGGAATSGRAAAGAVGSSQAAAGAATDPLTPPPCSTIQPSVKPTATIKLLDPGQEPRRKLRYKPRVGFQQTLSYALNTSMHVQQGGKTVQRAGVGFTLTLAARVLSATEEDSRFRFQVTKLEVPDVPNMPPEFTKGVRKELGAWKNVSGTMLVDAQGLTQKVDVKGAGKGMMAAGRANDIRVALEQTPNPFPAEPVGVGGKWEVATVVDTGLVLRGKQIFELVSLEGDRGKVTFTIDQRSDPKPGPAVCPQDGIVIQPVSWKATGGGERSFDLGKLIAGSYHTKLKVTNESQIWVQGKRQDQTVDIDMDTQMSTK